MITNSKTAFIFIIFTILMPSLVRSADYTPLVREGTTWEYLRWEYYHNMAEPEGICNLYQPYFLRFEGDSVVNGISYKKLYRGKEMPVVATRDNLYALMREEDKKVYRLIPHEIDLLEESSYFIDPLFSVFSGNLIDNYDKDLLLYDFNALDNNGCFLYNLYYYWEDRLTDPQGKYSEISVIGIEEVNGGKRKIGYKDFVSNKVIRYCMEGIGMIGFESANLAYVCDEGLTAAGYGDCHYFVREYNAEGEVVYTNHEQVVQDYLDSLEPIPLMGDCNGDMVTDASDVALIVDHIIGISHDGFNKNAADLNGDGQVDATDISALIRLILSE